jgi:hypothetical protein
LPIPRLFRKAEGPGQPATTKLRIPTGNKISKHHRADATRLSSPKSRRSPFRSRAHNARRAPSVSWGVLQSSASPKVGTGLNFVRDESPHPGPLPDDWARVKVRTGHEWNGTAGQNRRSVSCRVSLGSAGKSPAVVYAQKRLTADKGLVRTLTINKGNRNGTGLEHWDGTDLGRWRKAGELHHKVTKTRRTKMDPVQNLTLVPSCLCGEKSAGSDVKRMVGG